MEVNKIHFPRIDSTNTWSKENYKIFDSKKLNLVSADEQTAGRGRYKRCWLSPNSKNIYATFTFFIEKGRKDVGNIPQVLALSSIKTLLQYGFKGQLKWPNDIQINRKKVGGILCETVMEEKDLVVVIGIGLNINMELELLQQIDQPATSMLAESGNNFEVAQVLEVLKNYFKDDLDLFLKKGFLPFLEEYRHHIVHKKGDTLNINKQTGYFQSISQDGALILQTLEGKLSTTYSGEISP